MITVELFKNYFKRDFPYLPLWVEGKVYFENDVVYFGYNFYKSLIDSNSNPTTDDTSWEVVKGDEDEYLLDEDIEKAIEEAKLIFPESLFGEDEKDLVLYYLTACYLVIDIQNSSAGLSSTAYQGFTSSKSVGSVSESFNIPSWVNESPVYSILLSNGYGKKALSYIIPRARVQSICIFSMGATTI